VKFAKLFLWAQAGALFLLHAVGLVSVAKVTPSLPKKEPEETSKANYLASGSKLCKVARTRPRTNSCEKSLEL
jgi:hypothetical protein